MQEEGKKKGSSKNIFHIAVSRNDRFEAFIFLKILLFEVSKSLWNVKLCPLWANEVLITRFVKDKVCNTYSLFYWANLLASFFSLLLFYSGKEFQFYSRAQRDERKWFMFAFYISRMRRLVEFFQKFSLFFLEHTYNVPEVWNSECERIERINLQFSFRFFNYINLKTRAGRCFFLPIICSCSCSSL